MNADVVDELAARILRVPAPTGPHVPVTWFLDIDGVLNVIGRAPCSQDDWPRFVRKAVHAGDWIAWPFCYSPDLMDLLNLLVFRNLVQVRWLTTWEHDAYESAAPQLGLRLGRVLGGIDQGAAETGWWKLRVVKEHTERGMGAFIWTDDELRENVNEVRPFVTSLSRESGLVLGCDEKRGLVPAQLFAVLDYIERRYASPIQTS